MSQPAVIFDQVSKKFSRGEQFNSLRDLLPALATALVRRKPSEELREPVHPVAHGQWSEPLAGARGGL